MQTKPNFKVGTPPDRLGGPASILEDNIPPAKGQSLKQTSPRFDVESAQGVGGTGGGNEKLDSAGGDDVD